MASGKATALSNQVLDAVLGAVTYTAVTNTYVALFTTTPSSGGTSGVEVTATNAYARVQLTNNLTNWPSASAGLKSNGNTITFPTATGSGWGTVVGFGIYDALTSGNLLYFGPLSTSISVVNGSTVTFSAGNLQITES